MAMKAPRLEVLSCGGQSVLGHSCRRAKETKNEAINRRYVVNRDKKLKELYCEIMI